MGICRLSRGRDLAAVVASSGVPEHEDNRIAAKEHFRDETVLVDRLLALALGYFCPHLLDVFEHHVGVTIERFDSREELLVVAEGDEDLSMVTNRLLEDGEGTLRDLVLLELSDLRLVQFGLWDVDVLAVESEEDGQKGGETVSISVNCDAKGR